MTFFIETCINSLGQWYNARSVHILNGYEICTKVMPSPLHMYIKHLPFAKIHLWISIRMLSKSLCKILPSVDSRPKKLRTNYMNETYEPTLWLYFDLVEVHYGIWLIKCKQYANLSKLWRLATNYEKLNIYNIQIFSYKQNYL